MQLYRFEYQEHVGSPTEWKVLPFTLGPTTLLVGRNASGKSRLLSVIVALAKLLRSEQNLFNGMWSGEWVAGASTLRYDLKIENDCVVSETLTSDFDVKMERSADGTGFIQAVEAGNAELKFKIPTKTIAAFAKRDELQHPFLEPLHEWARYLRFYPFGSTMGRDALTFFHDKGKDPDPTNASEVVGLFNRATKKFGPSFEQSVIKDMYRIGYDLESVKVTALRDVIVQGSPFAVDPAGLTVKERDIPGDVQQLSMSQGMFRALSIVIHLRYAEAIDRASCILVDDIGEGLDFDRSTNLIKLLMDRAEQQKVQLIMSTNDRFVMNAVPLEAWAVIHRSGGTCRILNFENSRERFEEFKLTGLNNFDLLRTDFLEGAGLAR